MNVLGIIGAGGHGRVVADIAKKVGYDTILFFDDNRNLKACGNYLVAGDIHQIITCGYDTVVAIGNANIRRKIQEWLLKNRVNVVSLVHPDAILADDVCIGLGSVIMAGTVINSGTKVGQGCIINTCSSVDHDCVLGDYVHVSVGAHLAGSVTVGEGTWIGIGAAVSNNVSIPEKSMIGAGAVVINSLECSGTYVGVPAKKIK